MKALLFLLALNGFLMASAKEKKLILHQNGKVQYEYETEGVMLDGRFSCYYETGKLRIKGQFKANQKTGQWRYWDQNGMLRAERIYTGNQQFTVVQEYDSTGARVSSSHHTGKTDCDFKDYFFTHKYISIINNKDPLNLELFTENGFVSQLLHQVHMGNLDMFTQDNLETPVNKATVLNYDYNNIVSILVKETYHWCSKEQTLNNKVVGICPLVMEKGNIKELGWVYAPGLTSLHAAVSKMRDHAYASVVTKTTATDAGIRLQDVLPGENDLMRLLLIQFEANAILYKIDYQTSLATNR
jgi:hypothetical protein